ncbi:uncharacterized protein LOC135200600 [Macrobrachium nipponense]|uniref:uncharacterized protein LOC135200600 n=1 Tax=Macrobrachium nipponense TaxID=159736 RepID=UPI0030C7DF20
MVLRLHHRSVVNSYAYKFIPVAVAVILIFFVIVHDDAEMKDPSRNNQRGSSVIPKSRMRDRHDGAPSDDVRKYSLCKALFSLDSPVSEEKIEAIYSGKIRPNGDVFHRREVAKGREEVEDIYRKIDGVLSKIRKLKYSEPEHFSGEDYQPLAELLPSVAEYDSASEYKPDSKVKSSHSRNEPKHETDQRTKYSKQRTSSRIEEGTLPFVPCSIRGYEDKRQVFTCFQRRIDVQGSLSIHFFGDSKIRYLMHQFLEENNDVFHFVVVAKNITGPWPDAKSYLMKDFKWIDFEVITPALPRLQITFREVYSPFCARSKM